MDKRLLNPEFGSQRKIQSGLLEKNWLRT